MTDTAQAAPSDNAPVDGANNDGQAPQQVVPEIVEEKIVTTDTPQEEVDKLVSEALGDEFATAEPESKADSEATGEQPKAEDAKPTEQQPASETDKQDDDKSSEKPQKGYTENEDTKKTVEDAVKEAESLEKATIDTSDLFIEIKDANGETIKITLEDGVPDDIKFASDKQLYDVMDAMQEMRTMKQERQSELMQRQQKARGEADAAKNQQEQLKAWDAEIETLIETGILTEPAAKPGTPEFATDPTVQRVSQVFDFMAKENESRAEAGKPLINSFGTALTMLQNQEAKEAEQQKLKQGNDEAKAAGSIVGGSSSASGGNQEVYRAGSYNSIYDVPL